MSWYFELRTASATLQKRSARSVSAKIQFVSYDIHSTRGVVCNRGVEGGPSNGPCCCQELTEEEGADKGSLKMFKKGTTVFRVPVPDLD